MLHSRFSVLAPSFNLICLAVAQNSTSNSTSSNLCTLPTSQIEAVNSTGNTPFEIGSANLGNWYASVTFTDRRQNKTGSSLDQEISSWLSVPNGTEALACVYQLTGLNATATSTKDNGCDGVFSSACLSALYQDAGPGSLSIGRQCPELDFSDDTKKKCGKDFPVPLVYTSIPMNVSNTTCTTHNPPQTSLPDGYHTFSLFDTGDRDESDLGSSSFAWYDRHVKQPVPHVIIAGFRSDNEGDTMSGQTQIVCVTPDNVVQGSRVPPKSGVQGASWRGAWKTAAVASGAAGLMLML